MKSPVWAVLAGVTSLVCTGCASNRIRGPSSMISPVSFPVSEVIHGPPAPGSPADQADHKEVLSLQVSRSTRDCARAQAENKPTLEAFFGPSSGPLSQEEVARLNPYFNRVMADIRPVIVKAKDLWSRPRPSFQDARVSPCLPKDDSSSYPSGHAVLAAAFSRTLALAFPERKAEFYRRAEQIEDDRVLGGLHFRTDIVDGARLGEEVVRQMESSPEFQSMIGEMRGLH